MLRLSKYRKQTEKSRWNNVNSIKGDGVSLQHNSKTAGNMTDIPNLEVKVCDYANCQREIYDILDVKIEGPISVSKGLHD